MKIIINTDGASRGNPGIGSVGIVISNEKGEILKKYGIKPLNNKLHM